MHAALISISQRQRSRFRRYVEKDILRTFQGGKFPLLNQTDLEFQKLRHARSCKPPQNLWKANSEAKKPASTQEEAVLPLPPPTPSVAQGGWRGNTLFSNNLGNSLKYSDKVSMGNHPCLPSRKQPLLLITTASPFH